MTLLLAAWVALLVGLAVTRMRTRSHRLRARLVKGLVPILATVLLLVVVVRVPARSSFQLDLTSDERNSLSDSTKHVLASLAGPVTITAFFAPRQPGWEDAANLVKAYEREATREGRQLIVRFVDPQRDPGLAQQYQVLSYGQVVVEAGGRRESAFIPTEIELTGTLLRAGGLGGEQACLIGGHGEPTLEERGPSSLESFVTLLEQSGIESQSVSLAGAPPTGCDVFLLIDPKTSPLPAELQNWSTILNNAAKVLVAIDGPAGASWLEPLGVTTIGPVADPGSSVVDDPTAVVVSGFPSASPATAGVLPVYFTSPLALTNVLPDDDGRTAANLLATSRAAIAESSPARAAPYTLGIGIDTSRVEGTGADATIVRGRAAVIGDASWLTGNFLDLLGNRSLARQVFVWLLARENLLDIPDRTISRPVVISEDASHRVFAAVVVMPSLLFAAVGAAVALRRRRFD